MKRGEIASPAGAVSYLEGEGDGTHLPVAFVHGLTLKAETWLPFVERLGGRRWFAIDLPGHGASAWRERYSFADDAQALLDLLSTVVGPAVTVGHSRGAQVCLLAVQSRPDLFRGLYLEDLTPRFWWEAMGRNLPFAGSVFSLRQLAATARTEARDALWMARHIGELKHDGATTFAERLTPGELACWAEAALQFDPDMLGPRGVFGPPSDTADDMLRRIDVPMHLAHGDADQGSGVTEEELAWFLATAKQASATRFSGLGHFLHGARPTAFAADLERFLAEVP
jgi:pimeloyl-ACP methyl ester carboxylesterase